MYGTSIGYQTKIRRRWKRWVFPFLLVLAIGSSVYYIISDFDNLKTFFATHENTMPDEQELNTAVVIPKEKKQEAESFEEITDSVIEEQEEDKQVIFEGVNENINVTESIEIQDENPKIKEKEEVVVLTQSAVFDESEQEETEPLVTESEFDIDEKETVIVAKDTAMIETETEDDVLPTVKKKESYYVIVGSVVSKEAADKQQQKFLTMSEKTDVIYESSNKRYRISLGCYPEFKQASAKSKSFQAKHPSYKTWIWKTALTSGEL